MDHNSKNGTVSHHNRIIDTCGKWCEGLWSWLWWMSLRGTERENEPIAACYKCLHWKIKLIISYCFSFLFFSLNLDPFVSRKTDCKAFQRKIWKEGRKDFFLATFIFDADLEAFFHFFWLGLTSHAKTYILDSTNEMKGTGKRGAYLACDALRRLSLKCNLRTWKGAMKDFHKKKIVH